MRLRDTAAKCRLIPRSAQIDVLVVVERSGLPKASVGSGAFPWLVTSLAGTTRKLNSRCLEQRNHNAADLGNGQTSLAHRMLLTGIGERNIPLFSRVGLLDGLCQRGTERCL
jgi:hypothetical protein